MHFYFPHPDVNDHLECPFKEFGGISSITIKTKPINQTTKKCKWVAKVLYKNINLVKKYIFLDVHLFIHGILQPLIELVQNNTFKEEAAQ